MLRLRVASRSPLESVALRKRASSSTRLTGRPRLRLAWPPSDGSETLAISALRGSSVVYGEAAKAPGVDRPTVRLPAVTPHCCPIPAKTAMLPRTAKLEPMWQQRWWTGGDTAPPSSAGPSCKENQSLFHRSLVSHHGKINSNYAPLVLRAQCSAGQGGARPEGEAYMAHERSPGRENRGAP